MRIHSSVRTLVLSFFVLALSAVSFAQVSIAIRIGPPPIPVYTQPACPADGYIWTPGYWAYDNDYNDYYWVPGTWILAPQPGFLWTPGWWGWGGDAFIFHQGYWGPRVGFYGGINYGFGYFGDGFEGGRWDHDHFYYNRSVTNVNVTNVTNVYNTTVINRNETRVSYNGGNGGLNARPTPEQEQIEHERHLPPVAAQTQHVQTARTNPELRASTNHGKPPIAATAKPNEFRGEGVVPAKEAGAEYKGAPHGENNVPKPPAHAKDLPAHEKQAAPNTGNPKQDAKYQQQQDKLYAKQEQDHQKMAQKQEQEHQKMVKQNANEQKQQQMEAKHQQQTQQMEQHHAAQTQQMQQHQQPSHAEPQKH
jgi:WXXGXW repeat (2 copies)